jgi:hypothetical protein
MQLVRLSGLEEVADCLLGKAETLPSLETLLDNLRQKDIAVLPIRKVLPPRFICELAAPLRNLSLVRLRGRPPQRRALAEVLCPKLEKSILCQTFDPEVFFLAGIEFLSLEVFAELAMLEQPLARPDLHALQ